MVTSSIEQADSGGGPAGGAAGSGPAGAGGQGQGSGAAGAGGGGAAPIRLSADTLIDVDGKPVKYGDYQKGYLPRDQVSGLVREIIGAAMSRQQPHPRPQQQHQAHVDPFADIEAMPLTDGKTVAALARRLLSEGFGPRDKVIQALQRQVQDLSGHVTISRTGDLQNDYAGTRDAVIKSLPLPKTDKPIAGAVEALNEFMDGVFWKYDFETRFADPRHRAHVVKEFGETAKKEFEQLRGFFREVEKAELDAANDRARQRRFVRPTAGTGPNGPQRPIRESNAQKAARLFRGVERPT